VIVRAAASLQWLLERIQYAPTAGARAIEAVDAAGRIRGMVAFDGWTESAAHMHVALESPIAARALLRVVFRYLFLDTGRSIAIGVVPSHNARALAFDKRLGFREVHRIEDGWAPGDDLVILEMRRTECRFIPQERRAA
jgi:RimJ/RimL family protein N-acetyltransferase